MAMRPIQARASGAGVPGMRSPTRCNGAVTGSGGLWIRAGEGRSLCAGVASSAPQEAADKRHHHRQHDRDDDRAGDGDVEGEILALDHDIARQPPQPQPRERPPEQADDDEHDAREDESARHEGKIGANRVNAKNS